MITRSSIKYYVIEWEGDVLLYWKVVQWYNDGWWDVGGKGTHTKDTLITSTLKLST